MRVALRFALPLLAAGLVATSHAQTPKASSDDAGKADASIPATGRASEAVIEAQLRTAERPETAARIAAYKRNLYEALLKKGFTGDQAIAITVATPIPTPYPTR